jgi:hypothetical protein
LDGTEEEAGGDLHLRCVDACSSRSHSPRFSLLRII